MALETVAVFGGSGKIGTRIIEALVKQGKQVRALVHHTPISAESVQTVSGSVTDPEATREVVRGADAVVHMATAKEDPATFFEVSIRGTFNVLDACRHEEIQQFILFGGDAIQGIWFYPQPTPINENHPKTAYPGYYAFSKVVEEVMAEQYAIQYGLPVSMLRCSWVFEKDDLLSHLSLLKNMDPEEKGHGFGEVTAEILSLIEAGEERIPILTNAEGTPYYRHIVHIDDVIQAFEKILGNESAHGQDFNIAAPAPFDYRVAAKYVSERLHIPTIEIVCPGYHSFEIDISKARSVLGYTPQNDIFRMIDRAVAYRHSLAGGE